MVAFLYSKGATGKLIAIENG